MPMNKSTVELIAKGPEFYSSLDEDAFFYWLDKIECVNSWRLGTDSIVLEIDTTNMNEEELRGILALFYRYEMDMKQLKQFMTKENAEWFARPIAYWHNRMFEAS